MAITRKKMQSSENIYREREGGSKRERERDSERERDKERERREGEREIELNKRSVVLFNC